MAPYRKTILYGTLSKYYIIWHLIEILYYMAPYRKTILYGTLSKYYIIWHLIEILYYMAPYRNTILYATLNHVKKVPVENAEASQLYKRYHNMIVNIQRVSKRNYFTSFVQENHSNVKKGGMVFG